MSQNIGDLFEARATATRERKDRYSAAVISRPG
jgi:hypothetical protein